MSKKCLVTFMGFFFLGTAFQLNAEPIIDFNLPQGSYNDRCHSCWRIIEGPGAQKPFTLRCWCDNSTGGAGETKLPIDWPPKCKDIADIDGRLVCK